MIDITTTVQPNLSYNSTTIVSRRRRGMARHQPPEATSALGGMLVVALDGVEALRAVHGDPAMDLVRDHVARILRLCLRAEDGLVRWGAEQFMILLPRAERLRVADLAELLVMAVRLQPLRIEDDKLLRLTCSVGWATFDWDRRPSDQPWQEPIAVADAALALAQAIGGDCSVAPAGEPVTLQAAQVRCA